MINLNQKSPERAFALQKYLLLHSQHDALQKRLNQISSSLPTTTTTTTSPSPSASPSRLQQHDSFSSSSSGSSDDSYTASSSSPPKQPGDPSRSNSIPAQGIHRPPMKKRRSSLPAVVNGSILEEIEEDETKLNDVNEQIKIALTTLLNCESVKTDRRYRSWVQTRLMETEMELKKSRSRSCDMRKSDDLSAMF